MIKVKNFKFNQGEKNSTERENKPKFQNVPRIRIPHSLHSKKSDI